MTVLEERKKVPGGDGGVPSEFLAPAFGPPRGTLRAPPLQYLLTICSLLCSLRARRWEGGAHYLLTICSLRLRPVGACRSEQIVSK